MEDELEEKQEQEEKAKSHILLKLILFLIIIIFSLYMYARYVGINGLIVREYRVTSDILTDNFNGIKIVQFSDLLYGSTIDKTDVKEIVNKINYLNPDIVVFTGDLVSNKITLTDEDKEYLISSLTSIKCSIAKYAVYGDNDYKNNDFSDIMIQSNFKILKNKYDLIYYKDNNPIYIVGLSSNIKENVNLTTAFDFYKEEDRKYTIVIAHDGSSYKYVDDSNYEVDLVLLGHSLNGLINIPYIGGIIKDKNSYKYVNSYYQKGITDIYVSGGLGTLDYPYRLNNRPSISLYRLKAQN